MRRPCISRHLLYAVLALLMLSGCAAHMRNKQLENVAKDWSYVVRASQVIPVYPLTEDLQPGDILLVSTPIDEQQKLYAEKGYLPLDQLLKRLNPSGYQTFYQGRYGTDDGKIPPAKWQETAVFGNQTTHQWRLAPHAAFPTYDFEVGTGAGMNLAIPVQGVPIALGLMKTGKAKGIVTFGQSYTFGLDNVTLKANVDKWASKNRELLRSYKPVGKDGGKRQHFLRVVSRVYAIGDISVTINNDDSAGGSLGGGADKTVPLPELKDRNAAQNYQDALKVFNDVLKDQLPGGKVKFAAASSRSVTLNEHFERPLVIGYIGFDMPILEGGRLGAPISTLAQLTDTPFLPPVDGNNSIYRLAAFAHMVRALQEVPGPEADAVRKNLDSLGTLLPERYPFTLYEFSSADELRKDAEVVSGAQITRRDFRGVLDYFGKGTKTIDTLERYISQTKPDAAERTVLEADLRAAREATEKLGKDVGKQPALAEAVDFVFLGY